VQKKYKKYPLILNNLLQNHNVTIIEQTQNRSEEELFSLKFLAIKLHFLFVISHL